MLVIATPISPPVPPPSTGTAAEAGKATVRPAKTTRERNDFIRF
jgi:hypothetical protein